jgi:F420-dependent oxidoreductase-like protein
LNFELKENMPASHELRFGVQCAQEGASYPEFVAFWRRAEALGYDWLSFPDHFRPARLAPDAPSLETTALLAAVAASTHRLRLSTLALCNGFRHPAVLAKTLATIDHVSGGRLELGLGAGWDAVEHEAYGLPFPSAGERVRRLEEAVQVIKALWTEERANFAGRYYTLREAICAPKPLQHPHPPVWIGGAGEQLTLRVVARHADGWNASILPPEEYAHKAEILARHCAEAGRDPAALKRSLVATVICAETDAAAEALLTRLEAAFTGPLHRENNLVGGAESCAERLATYLRLGVTDIVVRAHIRPLGFQLIENFMRLVVPRLRAAAP